MKRNSLFCPRCSRSSHLKIVPSIFCRLASAVPANSRRSVAGALAELDGDVHFLAATIDGDVNGVAGAFVVEDEVDIELAGHFLAVDGAYDVTADVDSSHASLCNAVATANPCGGSRSTLGNLLDQQALFHGQIQGFTEPGAYGPGFHAEKCTVNAAVGHEVVGDIFCSVD